MASTFTPLLKFNKPALGDTGWGTAVNGGFTDLADSAIAGTTTLSTDADVTLTTANGATDQARQMILNCTGSRAAQRTITAPAASKVYVVINGTSGGFGVKLVGAGPTTGVVVPAGRMAVLAWNGSDFVTLGAVVDLTASGNVSFDGGSFVFNESGADKDARFEGDTDPNLLFLDASTDRVGIGTSSPSAKLDVNGPAAVTSFTGSTRLGLTVKGSTAATDYSGIDFSGNSQAVPTARIGVLTEAFGSSLVFGTSNNYSTGVTNTALVIDASGNLGVGSVTSAFTKVYCLSGNDQHGLLGQTQGTGSSYYGVLGTSTKPTGVPSGGTIGISRDGATFGILGYFDTVDHWGGYFNGNVYTTGSYQPSDARLKENVQTLSESLQTITALRPVEFDWHPDSSQGKAGKGHDVGLIAQEVLPILPGLVKEIAGASPLRDAEPSFNAQLGTFYTLDYTRLVPHLIGAIKEQQALIAALTARVAALEAK